MLAAQQRPKLHKAELQSPSAECLAFGSRQSIESTIVNACSPTETRAALKKLSIGTRFFEFSIIDTYVQAWNPIDQWRVLSKKDRNWIFAAEEPKQQA